MKPAPIDLSSIKCNADGKSNSVTVDWTAPWNGVAPDYYSVWEHIAFKEFLSNTTSIVLQNSVYKPGIVLQIWVRPMMNGWTGKYSSKFECTVK